MTTVTVHLPGTMSQDAENPDYDIWTFSVTVNGRAGLSTSYFDHGTAESVAASMTHSSLMANPGSMEGITSTSAVGPGAPSHGSGSHGPGSDGSPSTVGTGLLHGPIDPDDDDDDKDPPKMKTADGT